MNILKEFRDFALKGNVIDLAVGLIIGAAFGGIVSSLVGDVLMPPIGKLIGNIDFSNLYISLSDKVDAANRAFAEQIAATQPSRGGSLANAENFFGTSTRLTLDDAKKLGPVIAYGKFITSAINLIIVAFCLFMVVKIMTAARKRFEHEQAAAAAASPPPDVQLLTEIRDILKSDAGSK